MKVIFKYALISLTTFLCGAACAGVWFVANRNQSNENSIETIKLTEEKSNTKLSETISVNDHQFSPEEIKYRSDHTIRPRSKHSDIIGKLSEFANLYGKTETNTFYISEIKVDEDGDSETNDEYVYVYWKEDNGILILYPPFYIEDVTQLSWFYDMRRIDLAKHIVRTQDEADRSNRLVTREFANALLDKCVKKGLKVTIDKSNFNKK